MLTPEIDSRVYELTHPDRHRSGSYYTPDSVVTFMCREGLKRYLATKTGLARGVCDRFVNERRGSLPAQRKLLAALRSLRVLDPACGCGAFLVGMFHELNRLLRGRSDAWQIITKNLRGIELDPVAADITRRRLALLAGSRSLPLRTIKTADALSQAKKFFNCDLIVMNPPYVATYSRQSEKSSMLGEARLKAKFTHSGRLNLFSCFIARTMELLPKTASAIFIVPDSFATSRSYATLRRECFLRFGSQTWILLKPAIFGAAGVRNVIVSCSPGAANLRTDLRTVIATSIGELSNVKASRSIVDDDAVVRFFGSNFERELWQRLRQSPLELQDLFDTRDGVNPGPRRVRERLLDASRSTRAMIEGKHIDPAGFSLLPARTAIRYEPNLLSRADKLAGASLRDPRIFQSPKIVSRQTADTLIAGIDLSENLVTLNSVHCTRSKSNNIEELWGLLGLLNSPLARLFYALDGGETRELLPQVHIRWLRSFPLPAAAHEMFTALAPLSRAICAQHNRASSLRAIHDMVCRYYGLTQNQSGDLLRAYLLRYPRFAGEWVRLKLTRDQAGARDVTPSRAAILLASDVPL